MKARFGCIERDEYFVNFYFYFTVFGCSRKLFKEPFSDSELEKITNFYSYFFPLPKFSKD